MRARSLSLSLAASVLLAGCGPSNAKAPPPTVDGPKACTKEAKICPDGTAVSRTGPNCEFAACPNANAVPAPSTSTSESPKRD